MAIREAVEAVVVGAGAGGGCAAKTLAVAGVQTLLPFRCGLQAFLPPHREIQLERRGNGGKRLRQGVFLQYILCAIPKSVRHTPERVAPG